MSLTPYKGEVKIYFKVFYNLGKVVIFLSFPPAKITFAAFRKYRKRCGKDLKRHEKVIFDGLYHMCQR